MGVGSTARIGVRTQRWGSAADADNLVWKLAAVTAGTTGEALPASSNGGGQSSTGQLTAVLRRVLSAEDAFEQ